MVRFRTAPADRLRFRDNTDRAGMERETGFGPATLSLEG